jgi:SAM-dependent methyltransferase
MSDPAIQAEVERLREALKRLAPQELVPPLKLDLGCGTRKREGFTGVDSRQFEGVDVTCDLGRARWPWGDNTVDEAHCSHVVEHLEAAERIHFVNELYRVLKPGAKATIITPHWDSARAYGDLTHKWPPVCEWWFNYLDENWRKNQAPHNDGYTCNFAVTYGYVTHPMLATRTTEVQQWMLQFYKEAAQDMIATLIKK